MPFVRFIGFSVVRAWQGFWRNAMMSLAATATVVLMLVLLAALVIVISGLNSGLEFIESKVGVTVRLADGLSSSDREALMDDVEELPGVASVEYISPEEAMETAARGVPRVGAGARHGRRDDSPVRQPRDHARRPGGG